MFSRFSQNAAIWGKSQNWTLNFRFGNAHIWISFWKKFHVHFHEHLIFRLIFTELSRPTTELVLLEMAQQTQAQRHPRSPCSPRPAPSPRGCRPSSGPPPSPHGRLPLGRHERPLFFLTFITPYTKELLANFWQISLVLGCIEDVPSYCTSN